MSTKKPTPQEINERNSRFWARRNGVVDAISRAPSKAVLKRAFGAVSVVTNEHSARVPTPSDEKPAAAIRGAAKALADGRSAVAARILGDANAHTAMRRARRTSKNQSRQATIDRLAKGNDMRKRVHAAAPAAARELARQGKEVTLDTLAEEIYPSIGLKFDRTRRLLVGWNKKK